MSVTWNDVMKFDIPKNPVIFDIGGYKGDWVKEVMDRYENPTVYVFEPIKSFYDEIVNRWKSNPNVKVFNFGLSDENREIEISIEGDASSVFKKGSENESAKLRDIREFLFEEGIFKVDLAKINIEGEEYRLLEYMSSTPEFNIIDNYLVQFHKFIDNFEERRKGIVDNFSKYYDNVFDYEFIFEGWSLKKIQDINCIGDSHVSSFSNVNTLISENMFHDNGNFRSYRFGPYLAYNLHKKQNVLNVANSIDKEKNLLMCFGEIDCRAQVKKISDTNEVDYKKTVDDIVENYFQVIDSLDRDNLILFSVAPDLMDKPFFYYYNENPEVFDCPRGTMEERQEYKRYFNEQLEIKSKERGYKYISIFDHVNDSENKEKYYLDDIHLSPKSVLYLIQHEFIKNGITI